MHVFIFVAGVELLYLVIHQSYRLLMNFLRHIVSFSHINHKHERIIPAVMNGQSKINAFFKRQCASSEDCMKTTGTVRTQPIKRKRDENKSEVSLLY